MTMVTAAADAAPAAAAAAAAAAFVDDSDGIVCLRGHRSKQNALLEGAIKMHCSQDYQCWQRFD